MAGAHLILRRDRLRRVQGDLAHLADLLFQRHASEQVVNEALLL